MNKFIIFSILFLFSLTFISAIDFPSTTITIDWSGNITNFLGLNDTPNSYFGEADKCVTVKTDESGLEFTECSSSITDTNASTACSGSEVLLGNGTCQEVSSLAGDTNETTRINTMVGTDCGAGNYSYGFDDSGNIQCREDVGISYTAGSNLTLSGSEFSVNMTSVENYFNLIYHPLWDYNFGDLINVPSYVLWSEIYDVIYNETEVDNLLAGQDECSEITGCVENAITNATMNKSVSCSDIIGSPDSDFCTDADTGATNVFDQSLNTTDDVLFNSINSSDWTNVSITESQISDLGTYIPTSDLPLANLTQPHCSNITGATSDLCTLVDTTGGNTTEEIQDAIGGGLNLTLSYDDTNDKIGVNQTWITSFVEALSKWNDYVLIANLVDYVGNWSADKGDYYTSSQIDGFNFYNSTTFGSDYYNKTDIDSFNYYNATDFNIADYYLNSNPNNFLNQTQTDLLYAVIGYGDDWNKTYADTLYADISVTGDNESWNESYANTLYIGIGDEGNLNVNSSEYWDNLNSPSDINAGDITDDGTYRLQSWDNITGIPHATPSDGDTTHFSLADEIYDWAVGLFIQSIVEDTTPQLGGSLDAQTNNITNVSYFRLNKIIGACDLTINGTICSNSTGTYIVG